jgi:hypothetical protein
MYMDNVFVFRALNSEQAFKKALGIGYANEEEYLNGEHQKVRWAFKEIISLDLIDGKNLNGKEVYSSPVEFDPSTGNERDSIDIKYKPEDSIPTMTVPYSENVLELNTLRPDNITE